MGAKVTFKIISAENGFSAIPPYTPEFKEGQIIFVKDRGKIYVDYDNERTCYTSSGINYVGIVVDDFDPTKSNTWKFKGKSSTFTPNDLDMVVCGTKEYLYRNGGWHEIGDEDAPEWNT